MTEEAKNAEAATQAQPTAEGQAPAELTINDLNAIKTIIDVASTRGAFRANEMESVGKVFNKLNSFLESVTPKQAEGEAPAAPADQGAQTTAPAAPAQ